MWYRSWGQVTSTVMTMDVYSHVLPSMREGAADKLEKLLFG